MIFIAECAVPKVPEYVVHQMLWALYDLPAGSERPFTYRIDGDDRAMVVSRIPPSIPSAPIRLRAGRTYAFDVTANLTRWTGRKERKLTPITGNHEQRMWISDRMRGARIVFAQAYRSGTLRFTRPGGEEQIFVRTRFAGRLYVRDAACFTDTVLSGIGRGRFAGLGMIYLPEVMDGAIARLRASAQRVCGV